MPIRRPSACGAARRAASGGVPFERPGAVSGTVSGARLLPGLGAFRSFVHPGGLRQHAGLRPRGLPRVCRAHPELAEGASSRQGRGAHADGLPALTGRKGRRRSAAAFAPNAAGGLNGRPRLPVGRGRRHHVRTLAAGHLAAKAAEPLAAGPVAKAAARPAPRRAAGVGRPPRRGAGRGRRGGKGEEGRGLGEELRGAAEHRGASLPEPEGEAEGGHFAWPLLLDTPARQLRAAAPRGFSPVALGDKFIK
mmetsp:Transcript_81765/g.243853  ORF Transcript_81765/g.243853 Transcript_81765/m.243853 type:complete len:250 (+) Transcript_81765:348-1097(+)